MFAQTARRCVVTALACVLAAAGVVSLPAPAFGDDFVDRVNAPYAQIREDKRADLVLFPALAAMDAPPPAVGVLEDGRPTAAMLLAAGMEGWDRAAAWAQSPAQVAALEALDQITRVADPVESMVIAQPYGVAGVSPELVRARMYTELGDPPTLTTAKIQYLPAMSGLVVLAHVEATRRLDAGDADGAIDLLADLMHLGRMMADRSFFEEVQWGFRTMVDAAIRLRDIAFVDYNAQRPDLGYDPLLEAIDRLEDDREGFLRFDRLRLPEGDYVGGLQVLERIFEPRGQPTDRFGAVMSALTTADRPLKRFGQAGTWGLIARVHADGLATRQKLDDVYNDWAQLWTQSDFAPGHKLVREYDKLNMTRHAVVRAVMPDMTGLFNERRILRTEVAGTRQSFGVVAYQRRLGTLPVNLASLRPLIIEDRDLDPFAPRVDAQGRPLAPEFNYLVPRRDLPVDPRVGPQPLPVDVIMLNQRNFGIDVGVTEDEFVLWSVGPDTDDDTARRVRENTRALYDGDYLIWPPIISLYRQFLTSRGELQ